MKTMYPDNADSAEEVLLKAVYEAEGQPPLNALEHFVRKGMYDKAKAVLVLAPDLKISEAFPKDRVSLGCLWQFILDEYAGLSEPLKQEVSKLLDLRVISKEEPPLNALEHFVRKGMYDKAKAVLVFAPGLKISEAFPTDWASLGCLWQFILDEYAGLSEPLKQEVPKLLNLCIASDDQPYELGISYNAFNYYLSLEIKQHCLKILTHAPESALQPHTQADEEMMRRALWCIIQAQLAKRDLGEITEETLKDIMGLDRLCRYRHFARFHRSTCKRDCSAAAFP